QAIEPLPGVAGLRSRRDGAGLDKAKAERERSVTDFRMLVEACCKSDRVGKGEIPNLGGEDRIINLAPHGAAKAKLDSPDAHAVGAFRIEEKQRRSREPEEKIADLESHAVVMPVPGDTICSTAAAIANNRRSAPCSPTSISPTGASPGR